MDFVWCSIRVSANIWLSSHVCAQPNLLGSPNSRNRWVCACVRAHVCVCTISFSRNSILNRSLAKVLTAVWKSGRKREEKYRNLFVEDQNRHYDVHKYIYILITRSLITGTDWAWREEKDALRFFGGNMCTGNVNGWHFRSDSGFMLSTSSTSTRYHYHHQQQKGTGARIRVCTT